jgi:hypothetical protein
MTEKFNEVLNKIADIKALFSTKKEAFGEAMLKDGTMVAYDGDLAVGSKLYVVQDGEQIQAPEGTHALGGDMEGVSVVVDAEGFIVELIDEREGGDVVQTSEDSEPVAETTPEPAAEQMSSEKVEEIISAKLDAFSEVIGNFAEMFKNVALENEILRNDITALKGEFDTFKAAPSNNDKEAEKFARVSSGLTTRQIFLKSQMK